MMFNWFVVLWLWFLKIVAKIDTAKKSKSIEIFDTLLIELFPVSHLIYYLILRYILYILYDVFYVG